MPDIILPEHLNAIGWQDEYVAKPDRHDRVQERAWLFAGSLPPVMTVEAHDDRDRRAHGAMPEDLMAVIAHFARALGADGWALALVAEGSVPVCLARGGPGGAEPEGTEPGGAGSARARDIDALVLLAAAAGGGAGHVPAAPMWLMDGAGEGAADRASALVISASHGPGGNRLFVTLVFTDVERDERIQIEGVALHHWLPVAAYLRLWQAAGAERHRAFGIEAGLNFVAIGIVLLADDGRIVFANEAARALIDRQDGIREHRGQLQATHRADVAPLSSAINYALAGPDAMDAAQHGIQHGPLLALNRRQGGPLVASFGAMPMERGAGRHGALVCFVDPGLDIHQLAQPVCRLFQLSRVETELACLLVSGQTLAEAARMLHVKIDTARGYLKHIFLKTGSNRQVDLVRLIFSNLVRTRLFTGSQRP